MYLQPTLQNENNWPFYAIDSTSSPSQALWTRYQAFVQHTLRFLMGGAKKRQFFFVQKHSLKAKNKNLHRVHPVPAEFRGAASIPVKRSRFPHKIHLEVVSDFHGSSHAAPQLDGYLITIICRTSLSSNLEQTFEFYSSQFWWFSSALLPHPQQI